jgi:hypothetical protein
MPMNKDRQFEPVEAITIQAPYWSPDRSRLDIVSPAWWFSTVGWIQIDFVSLFLIGVEVRPGKLETGLRTEMVKATLTQQRAVQAIVSSSAQRA